MKELEEDELAAAQHDAQIAVERYWNASGVGILQRVFRACLLEVILDIRSSAPNDGEEEVPDAA